MAQSSFTVDSNLHLILGDDDLALKAGGSVDYPNVIANLSVEVNSSGEIQAYTMLADGVTMWAKTSATNDMFIQGDAGRLRGAASFTQSGLIGAFYMLRAATEVEAGDVSEVDGVTGREYRTSFTYDEALTAAGPNADAFSAALSLTGEAANAKLLVTAWIGDDNIIRNFHFDVEDDVVTGNGDIQLTQVGQPVAPPTPPPADQTITGAEADQILDQIIG